MVSLIWRIASLACGLGGIVVVVTVPLGVCVTVVVLSQAPSKAATATAATLPDRATVRGAALGFRWASRCVPDAGDRRARGRFSA
jgi:hypothetical protein